MPGPRHDRLSRTIRRWEPEILAWHATRLTNGPTEAVNLLVKKIKRVGHGFRNFENYRLRLLLHCGVSWSACCTNGAGNARDLGSGQAPLCMAFNFRPLDRDQQFLLPPSMADWLPEDHLAWFVLEVVDALDLSRFEDRYRSDGKGAAA